MILTNLVFFGYIIFCFVFAYAYYATGKMITLFALTKPSCNSEFVKKKKKKNVNMERYIVNVFLFLCNQKSRNFR